MKRSRQQGNKSLLAGVGEAGLELKTNSNPAATAACDARRRDADNGVRQSGPTRPQQCDKGTAGCRANREPAGAYQQAQLLLPPMLLLAEPITPFDWQRLLWTADAPPSYLLEVVFRCVATYVLLLAALRVTGRRGVRQLSIFELSIILGLGTAAGDTMLYHDTPFLPVILVFAMVSLLYWFFNRLTEWFPRFSDWLEGTPVLLVEEGRINMQNLNNLNLTQKELFGELRQQQVEHLGQVRRAYMEATGNLSAYFYAPEETAPGLPIWPERLAQSQHRVDTAGPHACCKCGHVQEVARGEAATCPTCQAQGWVPVCDAKREA